MISAADHSILSSTSLLSPTPSKQSDHHPSFTAVLKERTIPEIETQETSSPRLLQGAPLGLHNLNIETKDPYSLAEELKGKSFAEQTEILKENLRIGFNADYKINGQITSSQVEHHRKAIIDTIGLKGYQEMYHRAEQIEKIRNQVLDGMGIDQETLDKMDPETYQKTVKVIQHKIKETLEQQIRDDIENEIEGNKVDI